MLIIRPSKRLLVDDCSIKNVIAVMRASPLRSRLEILVQSDWFAYVTAFVNTTKHQRLVQHALSVSLEQNRVGIQMGSFSYRGKPYAGYWGLEVLQGALEVKNTITECGRLLNAELGV